MHRLAMILLIAIGLYPATWIRSAPEPDGPHIATFRQLAVPPARNGELRLRAAWHIRSDERLVHGLSAMRMAPGGGFLALSDLGALVRLRLPGAGGPSLQVTQLDGVKGEMGPILDMESLAWDAATGTMWIGMEYANAVVRYSPGLRRTGVARPPAMRGWGVNSGAESMVRLADGRFIVVAEGRPFGNAPSAALLFPHDPVAGAVPQAFTFTPPEGYRPVDMAQLPDGRVLILLRGVELSLPLRFPGALMVADPATIRPGRPWTGRLIGVLDDSMPTDNFEALAVGTVSESTVELWIASDANNSAFQRTLLMQLLWQPESY